MAWAIGARRRDLSQSGSAVRSPPWSTCWTAAQLRYRLLHVAARLTRTARQTRLRIAEHWPWGTDIVTAFDRLPALPRPGHLNPAPHPHE